MQRDVYSQIFIDVSPGNRRQASSENRTQGGKPTLSDEAAVHYVTKPQYIPDEAAVQIARSKVSEILKSSKPPQRNITHEEEEALKELKKDESIVILKADKGNATIIMNATEYNDKINCLLSDSSVYSQLSKKSNLITKITSDVNKYV